MVQDLIFSCLKRTQARDHGAAADSVFDHRAGLLDGLGSAESMISLQLSWILARQCPSNDMKQDDMRGAAYRVESTAVSSGLPLLYGSGI
jgi:hypothetical protein